MPALIVRQHNGEPFYEAKFRYQGKQVKRRVGPAWLTRDGDVWAPHPGRVPDGYFDVRRANVRAAELVTAYVAELDAADEAEQLRLSAGPTFREVAHAYLDWLERVRGAKPATLRQHRSDLAEPGVAYSRGAGETNGHIMAALGDLSAKRISTQDVEELLDRVAATGVSSRTVNRVRDVVRAVFNFGVRSVRFQLPSNPAASTDRRRASEPAVLIFYTPEEIEELARTLESGAYRGSPRDRLTEFEDARDAEAVRVAAYAGLRLGEQLALRWSDVDWAGSALTISRAVSGGVEGPPKTGQIRRVPISDQAAAALERLSRRQDFTEPDDYVFCNAYGRRVDDSALRRRYKRARDHAALRPLRWHDLRHTFGSLLVAGGVDLVSVRDAMGHAQLATTSRYLHARPATERAASFTAAFATKELSVVDLPAERKSLRT
ncbi:MAG: site-specific integrase [Solirubrobacterales bacterium]|nr:site-specific integrase [Solirubrobacterales bacterium]